MITYRFLLWIASSFYVRMAMAEEELKLNPSGFFPEEEEEEECRLVDDVSCVV